jgi:hypothetical protein
MKGVSESMAGRVAVFQLLSLSHEETSKVSMLYGGFPEVLGKPRVSSTWFRSYIQTYLERDVRSISAIKELSTFRRFLSIVASRSGMILNKTDIAAPLGISVPAVTEWIDILEITGQIIVVPPFYENFGKRLIKSPKIYFSDSGLACYLLGIETQTQLRKSPFLGPIFEGYIASEIAKHQINAGKRRQIYYFRDQQGLEVDFLIPIGNAKLVAIEAKASRSVTPAMASPLSKLSRAVKRYNLDKYVINLTPKDHKGFKIHSLYPGIKSIDVSSVNTII